jgi:hypothetical protein
LTDEDANGEDSDGDGVKNLCDLCPDRDDPNQNDFDEDRRGNGCDNCPFQFNTGQTDVDIDGLGDMCDPTDGVIYVTMTEPAFVDWQIENGFVAWNWYKGDLETLRTEGTYTQEIGSNRRADRICGLGSPFVPDGPIPPGTGAFYLVEGVDADGVAGGLGPASSGAERPLDISCD